MRTMQTLMTDADHLRIREWLAHPHSPGQRRLAETEALRIKIRDAGVVCQREIPRDVVTMNSLVGLRDLSHDEKITCMLAYPQDEDSARRRVSVAVPLGTQMLGRRVGDTLDCPVKSGVRRLRIESVFYQPEAAGDFHL